MHPPSRRPLPRRLVLIAIAAIAVVAAAALAGAWVFMGSDPDEFAGIGGPFTLVDGTGRTVTDRDLRGHDALIYFGYTFCPDVCPTTLSNVAAALDDLGPTGQQIQPVFISIDPQRDTPPVVRDYVAAFSPRLLGLTGTAQQIAAVAREYRVYYGQHRTGEGPLDYTMDHSSILYLMGRNGALKSLIRTDQTPQAMADEIRSHL